MSRYKIREVIRDQQGNVVPSASVNLYLAGTETVATCYSAKSGGSTYATAPQVTTGADGSFELYVSDGDYDHDQDFKLKITKTGFTDQTIDYIRVFPDLSSHLMSKDGDGNKWYLKPRTGDGALERSTTKGDIVS